jgi:putative inorganic carbon (HCO3(-)) transporter
MEGMMEKTGLYRISRISSFWQILLIISLGIATSYSLVSNSLLGMPFLFLTLLFLFYYGLGMEKTLLVLLFLRVNFDAFHQRLSFNLGEYKSLSLPSLLGLFILAVGILYLLTRKANFLKLPLVSIFVIFFIICLFPFTFLDISINSIAELVELASFFFLYIMIMDVLKDEKSIQRMAYVLILSCLIPIITSFSQIFTNIDLNQVMGLEPAFRLRATMTHSNAYAFYLVMILVMTLSVILQQKSFSKRFFLFFLLIGLLLSLVFTYARGAWISLIFAILVLGIFKHHKLLFFVPLGIIGMLFLFPFIVQRFEPLLDPSQYQYTSFAWRIDLWGKSIDYFLHNPFWGIGFGNFIFVEYGLVGAYAGAHNDYLRILVESGIFGFLGYLALIGGLLILSIQAYNKSNNSFHKSLCLGFIGIWVAYVILSLTENLFNHGGIQWYFWAFAGLVSSIYRLPEEKKLKGSQDV